MKKLILFPLIITIQFLMGQEYQFFSGSRLNFESDAIGETFNIDIQLPENYFLADANVSFPLIILLDSQNEFTYEYNLRSIEMLVFHSQMPQPIVAGIPFNMQNRLYLTALDNFYSMEGKIEKTTQFIFDELIPHLKNHYRAGAPVLIFGHSRTGFLTSYLMVNRSEDFDVAGSFSGFFEKGFEINEMQTFVKKQSISSKPFWYFFSAGSSTSEEAGYLKDYQQINNLLTNTEVLENFKWHFMENPHSNHITNYNLSLPVALVQYFGKYNSLLDDWLFIKLKNDLPANPPQELKADFEALSTYYRAPIYPDFVHIYSIGSALISDQPEAALELFIWGKSIYPYEHELDYDIISLMLDMKQTVRAGEWLQTSLKKIQENPNLSENKKVEIKTALERLFD